MVLSSACSDILEVSLPGKVTSDALNNPLQAQVLELYNLDADFSQSWDTSPPASFRPVTHHCTTLLSPRRVTEKHDSGTHTDCRD
jgi:hypothetical protein